MSPKDLKTIHFLNKLLDAGVRVLKIEGRARGAEYVHTVVSCYREAVEAWQNGEYPEADGQTEPTKAFLAKLEDWNKRLATVFNRGFWDGYYQGQKLGEWTATYGSQATKHKVYAGKCTNFYTKLSVAEFYIEAVEKISEGDELLVTGETTGAYFLTAHDMHDADKQVQKQIQKGQFFALKTDRIVRRGDKLYIMRKENP
jgi:putative protease